MASILIHGILQKLMALITNGYGRLLFYLYVCVVVLDTVNAFNSRVPARNQQGRTTTPPGGKIHLDNSLADITVYEEETVKIECEITGDPIPTYSWYKNSRSVEDIANQDSRYDASTILWGSRLRIKKVRRSDSGNYTCVGRNTWGSEETSAYLTVLRGPNPNPKPTPGTKDRSKEKSEETLVIVGVDDPPRGEEEGYKPPTAGGGGAVQHGGLYPQEPVNSRPASGNGYCTMYTGVPCATMSSNRSIYVTDTGQISRMGKTMIVAATLIGPSNPMSERCSKFAIPALCHNAFPPCADTAPPRPRRLCQDECRVLEESLCKEEFVMARMNPSLSRILPNCDSLPDPGTPEAADCIRIGVPLPPKPVQPPGGRVCYNNTGTDYKGTVQRTTSGYTCQRWDSQWPHQHTINVNQPGERLKHNYCRNPDGSETSPWCYTTDPTLRKQICNIPKCVVVAEKAVSDVVMILVPSIAVPVGVALLLFTICMCRRNKTNANNKPTKPAATPTQVEMNALLSKQKPRAREFPISAIRFMQEMGEGTFGKVYKGELCGYYSDNTVTAVVIKTMKPGTDTKQQPDFRKEVELMTDMKHPNIICLLGVCLKDHPNCMLFEFLCNGDLHNYLNLNSPRNDVAFSDKTGHLCVLGYQELLHIAMQVASGMEYLASHRYVHRDLATRNVLVGENLTVKISDFGLARDIYAEDYYRIENQVLPVRWMPPEALVYGSLTVESDIWSYGVVLWEIFSYGLQPYYGYSNQEVIEMIRNRQMLSCPEECPPFIYTLMIECWQEMPIRRPSFKEIHTRLIQWKGEAVMNTGPIMNYGYIQPAPPSQSSSTHNSQQASHHSSTGPSNNTGTTALSGSSHTSPPITMQSPIYPAPSQQQQGHHHPQRGGGGGGGGAPYQPPHHHHQPMSMPYPPPNSHVGGCESVMYQPPQYQALYKKPSPPGSVASSQRSSSIHSSLSPASSVSNCKANNPYTHYGFTPIANGHFGQHHPQHQQYPNNQTEQYANNGLHGEPHKMLMGSCKPVSNDSGMYIPDVRTSEI